MRLAIADNAAELAYLGAQNVMGPVWLGAQLDPTKNRFMWLDGSMVDNSMWQSGQPGGGSCAAVGSGGGGLLSIDCAQLELYICESY
jgi:hypothetical protein